MLHLLPVTDITSKKQVCKAAWMKWFVISLHQRCNPEGSGATGEHLFQQPSMWGYVNTPLLSKHTQQCITPQHRYKTAVQCRTSHSFAGKKGSVPGANLKLRQVGPPLRALLSRRFRFRRHFGVSVLLWSVFSALLCAAGAGCTDALVIVLFVCFLDF